MTTRRVVISSVTGKPIDWEDPEDPVFADRVAEDSPEPGTDESNDVRLQENTPPHWGNGS